MLAKQLKSYGVGEDDLVLAARLNTGNVMRLLFSSSVREYSLTNIVIDNAESKESTLHAAKLMIEQTIKMKHRVLISDNEMMPDRIFALNRLKIEEITEFYQKLDYDLHLLFTFRVNSINRKMYELMAPRKTE